MDDEKNSATATTWAERGIELLITVAGHLIALAVWACLTR